LIGELSGLPHLSRRFFGHLTAAPLTPSEQSHVRAALDDDRLSDLFFAQGPADQRHAYDVAQRFAEALPDHAAGIKAALLHDVGKRSSSVGAIGRSLATLADVFSLPMPAAWRAYRDHGPRGADDLAAAGAEPLAVAFARHHPQPAPAGFDHDVWRALLEADDL
jgi:hypothetical protein